jgi:hypothetical protein
MSVSSQGELRLPAEARFAVRWVCTNNPFYVISAGLFLVGLWLSFGDPRQVENTWALMAGLGGYTLLLAGTAYLLVRFANVWDDARTVLLLVVLMFLATSVTFDEVLVVEMVDPQGGTPIRGIVCYLAGLLFAIAVSAGLLRGIRLTLPAGFRFPYYLILALFFLYPLALCPLLTDPRGEALQWGLFGFSSVAGLIFLTLLPAIRRGAEYVRDNGSPWPWPLYPWTLFGLLALAASGRAVLLCWSMHPIGGAHLDRLIFGPYFLAPFGLVLAILLLEMGLVAGRRGVTWIALAAPAGLIGLAFVGHRDDPVYDGFLRIFTVRLGGDPVYWTLIASAGFYAYASIRHVSWAVESLTASLAALSCVHPDILVVRDLVPQPAPLIAAATLLLGLGIWRRQSWRCLLGALGLVAGMALALPADAEMSFYRWAIAVHLVLFVVMIVATAFDDELARMLRFIGPFLTLLVCLGVMLVPFTPSAGVPAWLIGIYPPVMAAVLAGYGFWRWHPPTLAIAGLIFVCWSLASGWQVYRVCRQLVVGLDYLAVSLLVFMLAILVSLGKAGLLRRWLAARRVKATDSTE